MIVREEVFQRGRSGNMVRAGKVLLSVLVLALVASSCSADKGEPSPDASQAIKPGGTLTIGSTLGIPQLDPAIRTFAWEEVLFPLLWNGLTKTDEDGAIVPDLATSWEQSDGAKTWTFKLRDDVTFSNGKELTADDVVKSFEYYLDDKTVTQEKNKIDVISNVDAPDATTVTFALDSPVATFPAGITFVKILDMDSFDQIGTDPIGTGPFTVSDFTPNQTVTLTKNESFFGTPAPLDEIKIVTAAEATAGVTALRSGGLDILWNIPPTDAQTLEGGNTKVISPKAPSVWADWEMDITSPPFDDLRVRQALSYATDREAMLEAAFHGFGKVSSTNNPLIETNPAYGGDLMDYSYDLDKAKELFEAAGVDELTWWGIAGSYPEFSIEAQVLQASLKEIGVDLKIDEQDVSEWAAKFYPAGKKYPGLIVPNLVNFPADPAYSLNFLLNGRCECNWNDPDFEDGYRDAIGTIDEAERNSKWENLQGIVSTEVPVIIPFQIAVLAASGSGVGGFWLESGGQPHLESAGFTTLR